MLHVATSVTTMQHSWPSAHTSLLPQVAPPASGAEPTEPISTVLASPTTVHENDGHEGDPRHAVATAHVDGSTTTGQQVAPAPHPPAQAIPASPVAAFPLPLLMPLLPLPPPVALLPLLPLALLALPPSSPGELLPRSTLLPLHATRSSAARVIPRPVLTPVVFFALIIIEYLLHAQWSGAASSITN
jgi:hypothetical protein